MDHESFWAEYYEGVAQKGEPWLDYSNERVQAQTFGLVLEALGPLSARACLDVGCGVGQMARTYAAMGASTLVGIDLSEELISKLRASHPGLDFRRGSLMDATLRGELGSFDRVTLIEVLQYMPLDAALEAAWALLNPGGRLVVVVPNRACPIVERAIARFEGHYMPPSAEELRRSASELSSNCEWLLQGLWFAENQSLFPYVRASGPPRMAPLGAKGEGTEVQPNRFLMTIQKPLESC